MKDRDFLTENEVIQGVENFLNQNSQFSFVFLPLYRACSAKTFDGVGTHKRIGTIKKAERPTDVWFIKQMRP